MDEAPTFLLDGVPAPMPPGFATIAAADLAPAARAQRDALLSACDWTQVPDVPLTAELRAGWAAYRQALRAVPQQPGFPHAIAWPVPPTA